VPDFRRNDESGAALTRRFITSAVDPLQRFVVRDDDLPVVLQLGARAESVSGSTPMVGAGLFGLL
jgi:hypothetical protein